MIAGSSSDEELIPTSENHIKLCRSNFCHFISIPPAEVKESPKKIKMADEIIPILDDFIEPEVVKPKNKDKKKIQKNATNIRVVKGVRKVYNSEMAWHMDNIKSILDLSNATPILSKDQNGYSCCYCTKKFLCPKELKYHTNMTHMNKTKPKLKKHSKNLISKHIVFLDITALNCEICGVLMDTLENLMLHLKSDHDANVHMEIKNHIMPLKVVENDLICAVCEETVQFEDIPVHMGKHYRNYECELCTSVFINRGMKVDHQKAAHDLDIKL